MVFISASGAYADPFGLWASASVQQRDALGAIVKSFGESRDIARVDPDKRADALGCVDANPIGEFCGTGIASPARLGAAAFTQSLLIHERPFESTVTHVIYRDILLEENCPDVQCILWLDLTASGAFDWASFDPSDVSAPVGVNWGLYKNDLSGWEALFDPGALIGRGRISTPYKNTFTVGVQFTPGQEFNVTYSLAVGASIQIGLSSPCPCGAWESNIDVSRSLTVTGVRVTDSTGADVPDFDITSASGVAYRPNGVTAVPEPTTAVLLLSSLAVSVVRRRWITARARGALARNPQ
ncbi:MAG: PEP-CTERM sorting domain-containing protein [Vicinamibacterales bacterium]